MNNVNFQKGAAPNAGDLAKIREALAEASAAAAPFNKELAQILNQGRQLTKAFELIRQAVSLAKPTAELKSYAEGLKSVVNQSQAAQKNEGGQNLKQAKAESEQALAMSLQAAQLISDTLGAAYQNAVADRIKELNFALDTQAKKVDRIRNAMDRGGEAAQNYSATQLQAEEERAQKLEQLRNAEIEKQKAAAIIQLVINSVIAVSKAAAEGGVAAPFTIASTLIALAAGIALARSQAQSFASAENGGVVGQGALNVKGGGLLSGARHRNGGILIEAEDGERIFDRQTSRRFAPLFEAIAGRQLNPEDFARPASNAAAQQDLGRKLDGIGQKMDLFIQTVRQLPSASVSIDERGLHASVSRIEAHQQRIKKRIKRG